MAEAVGGVGLQSEQSIDTPDTGGGTGGAWPRGTVDGAGLQPAQSIDTPGTGVVWVNDAYLPYWRDDTRVQVFFGGAASGKSWFLAQRAVADVLRGRNYLIVRNVARTLRPSVFNQIVKVMGEMGVRQLFSVNRSELVITCRKNGRQMLFAGLDDAEKLKSITPEDGVLTDIWIEEATEVARDAYKQLTKRLRGREGAGAGGRGGGGFLGCGGRSRAGRSRSRAGPYFWSDPKVPKGHRDLCDGPGPPDARRWPAPTPTPTQQYSATCVGA